MQLRLTTVRAKLGALVGFSGIVMFTAVPVLWWVMDRQIVAQVDERVPAALHAFGLELDDDMRDLSTIVAQLSSQADLGDALHDGDAERLQQLGKIFHTSYPQVDLVFFGDAGKRVTAIEVDHPWADVAAVPEVANLPTDVELRTVTLTGCESGADALPAFVAARRIAGKGWVMACLPLDADYLNEVSEKLGVEVAFVRPNGNLLGTTARFPTERLGDASDEPELVTSGGRDWALARERPAAMAGKDGANAIVFALDVTDIRGIVRHNVLWAVGFLAIATILSIVMGSRLAGVMSRALARVNTALQKLERQEYVHVDMIHTGDELEDLAAGFNTMVDGLKERDKLRTTFGKYMTQTVMEHLMSGKVALGGETLTVTILFSDIRSFTTISEEMHDAQALVALLNEYFTEMVRIVMEEDGVVDKYIGDAIMAVFGAPVPKADDAIRAARAAVRMRHALAALNERLVARGVTPLRTGIGIHTGEVVAGNIGSEARMEYTVIGDAVNLASRLESSTKELGVDVLISADTYALVKGECRAKAVREITVKGRVEPVMTYELLGLKGDAR